MQDHHRSGSAGPGARNAITGAPYAEQPLIGGGLAQIGDAESKQQEEKQRKQREYREYLDMQKKQVPHQNINKPPSHQSGRPPSGALPPKASPGNFIAQSKSIKDEAYLESRRRDIGDQIFNELMSASRPGSSHGPPSGQQPRPDQYLAQMQQPRPPMPDFTRNETPGNQSYRGGSQSRQTAATEQSNDLFFKNHQQ